MNQSKHAIWYLLLISALFVVCDSENTGTAPTNFSSGAPTLDSFSVEPSTQVLPGDLISILAIASDPEGDPISSLWTSPFGTFDDPTSLSTTFIAPDQLGPLQLKLQLFDIKGNGSSFTFTLLVGFQEQNDADGDGYTWEEGDCNDLDPAISPVSPEIVDSKDNDCDGFVDENSPVSDDDGDLISELEGDCDDSNPLIYPGAQEGRDEDGILLGDGLDNDCDGTIDEGTDLFDDDGDGYAETEND